MLHDTKLPAWSLTPRRHIVHSLHITNVPHLDTTSRRLPFLLLALHYSGALVYGNRSRLPCPSSCIYCSLSLSFMHVLLAKSLIAHRSSTYTTQSLNSATILRFAFRSTASLTSASHVNGTVVPFASSRYLSTRLPLNGSVIFSLSSTFVLTPM